MDQSGDDHYADSEDVKINSIPSDENLTHNNEEPNVTDPLSVSNERSGYRRPRRQLKKTSKDCDIFLKSKMVGVMQDIMQKDAVNEDEIRERKRRVRRKEWRCETCGCVLPRKTALIMHQQRKHCPQNFSCSYCDKSFRNAMAMKVHERSHTKVAAEKTDQTTYMCEFCGKSFRGKKTLKEHHLANHSDE
jgi:rubrerythrin